jgi:hypothetical protein
VRRSVLAFVPLTILAIVACEDQEVVAQPCTNIPAGGCPLGHGVSCEDPACLAIYACRENDVWELRAPCPGRDAGGPTDAFVPETSSSIDASIDAPPGAFGGPGCGDLMEPDCALGIALACGPTCCGCEDLFVCENGGWELWGTCGDAGPRQSIPEP